MLLRAPSPSSMVRSVFTALFVSIYGALLPRVPLVAYRIGLGMKPIFRSEPHSKRFASSRTPRHRSESIKTNIRRAFGGDEAIDFVVRLSRKAIGDVLKSAPALYRDPGHRRLEAAKALLATRHRRAALFSGDRFYDPGLDCPSRTALVTRRCPPAGWPGRRRPTRQSGRPIS